jgi:hypothetical protein
MITFYPKDHVSYYSRNAKRVMKVKVDKGFVKAALQFHKDFSTSKVVIYDTNYKALQKFETDRGIE